MAGETVLVIDDSPTILKVVQLVLTREGYTVVTATDGDEGIEVARSCNPQVILLDFVMPKMNGYQVCRALHQVEELREVPVVLMSAKGDQVGDRFVKVMGIVDYITKPFSPEAITGVVQHTLKKYAGRQGLDEDTTGEVDISLEVEAEKRLAEAEWVRQARRQALSIFQEGLSRAAGKAVALGAADRGEALDDAEMAQWIQKHMVDEVLETLLTELRGTAPELLGQGAVLAGDLKEVPLAEVLQLLGQQEQQGILSATRGGAHVDLHFKGGQVQLGLARGISEEFLLGRFLQEQELITADQLQDGLAKSRETKQMLGTTLVKEGVIKAEDLRSALKQQTCEQVYELLRWKTGRFAFHAYKELDPMAVQAKLDLGVDTILMEGFRRVDEWHLIEREIEDFELVFLRNEEAVSRMGRGRLTREELAILEQVNGKNTVKEIIRQSRMGSFEVSQILYRLLSIKLIRRRVQPVIV